MKRFLIGVLIIAITMSFIIWNNLVVSKITLEINPSMEIRLNRNNKVMRVVSLNNDSKKIVKDIPLGKTLDETIQLITYNVVSNGYISHDEVPVLVYMSGNVDKEKLIDQITKNFEEKQKHVTIYMIESVNNEDIKLAKKYDVSIVRAAYINEMIKDNSKLDIDSLIDKSVSELRETKETGRYCDKEYTLEGDFCVKEINRVSANIGDVCPEGYFEFDGKCYEVTEGTTTSEYTCFRGFTLTDGNKCVGTERIDAIPNFKCDKGELIKRNELASSSLRGAGDPNEYLCEDRTNAKYPTERCYNQEHTIINGKCAMGPKPLLPTPSGCADDDVNYNGGCYDLTPDEPYICPDGERYDTNTEPCPDTFTYTKANGNYTCSDGYTLNGSRCEKEVTEPAPLKKICPNGYTILDSGHCINKNKTTDFIKGNVCNEPDSRLEGNTCILYKIIEAKR